MSAIGHLMADGDITWTVSELLEAGRCSAQCLCAYDDDSRRSCTCPCRGQFHGRLSDSEIVQAKRWVMFTRMSNIHLHTTSANGSNYAWDDRRPNILGIGHDDATARSELERVTEIWGHEENPPGYIYSDRI